jgi:5-methylcytosine-specific restriction endonuclease McrA
MLDLSKFLESYMPDNHWLSKSMELGKLEYGSYWYLKKMMVYYYYIFILKRLEKSEINEIKNNFNSFIDSLPEEAKCEAYDFFFEVNINNVESIITFNEFTMNKGFLEEKDLLNARKYYYTYLMALKPQNEKKKLINDEILSSRNFFEGRKNARIKLLVNENEHAIAQFERDVHAFLRNERQILFIMGLLNYTDTKTEEYTPTSIGIQAVNANFNELILLNELQKIKQISRNPLVYYARSSNRPRNRRFKNNIDMSLINCFDIKLHPYILYLRYLYKKKEVSNDEFRYLLSRSTDNHDENYIINFPVELLDSLKNKINLKDSEYIIPGNNNYNNDIIRGEDFLKEHKKYQLGITESEKDYDGNLFGVSERVYRGISLVNDKKLKILIKHYQKIINYLHEESSNLELFEDLREGHKKKYIKHISKLKFDKDTDSHIDLVSKWLEYFVSIDRNIIKMLILSVSEANNLSNDEIFNNFRNLCIKCLGIKSSRNIVDKLKEKEDIKEDNFDYSTIVIPYVVTENHLARESKKYLSIKNDFRKERIRNKTLISMYLKWYSTFDGYKTCEICGDKLEKKDDGSLICNVHHMIPFKENEAFGPDHYKNLLALCGTCHQKVHSLRNLDRLREMYAKIKINSALKKSTKERISEMYKEDYLYPTSLRFCVSKGMINHIEEKRIIKK